MKTTQEYTEIQWNHNAQRLRDHIKQNIDEYRESTEKYYLIRRIIEQVWNHETTRLISVHAIQEMSRPNRDADTLFILPVRRNQTYEGYLVVYMTADEFVDECQIEDDEMFIDELMDLSYDVMKRIKSIYT